MSAIEYFIRTASASEIDELAKRLEVNNADHAFDGLIESLKIVSITES